MKSPAAFPTAFHVRTAEHNLTNAWLTRGGFTVSARFSTVTEEALAARFACALADITPVGRLRFSGAGGVALLSSACGESVTALAVGAAQPVYWTTQAGGVRGTGVLARLGPTDFLLVSVDIDLAWFSAAAVRFAATLRDQTAKHGFLMLAGPMAPALLAAAGLADAARLEPLRHTVAGWRGLKLRLSRWLGAGYEIACDAADGVILFDRLMQMGAGYALTLAGHEAVELLALEAGALTPGLDFTPARHAGESEPSAAALGLDAGQALRVIAAVECDSETPSARAPLFREAASTLQTREFQLSQPPIGTVLRAAYSPALRRTLGFAMLERAHAAPGTRLVLRRFGESGLEEVPARVVPRPFL
jgi:glycine cleavage system aminomethyltransferase T